MAGNNIHINVDENRVIVQEGQTQILEVVSQGPQGAVGPQGPAGPTGSAQASGPIQAVQYNKDSTTVSGSSLFLFDDSTGTLTLSGSFLMSGSLLPNADSGTGISSFSLGSATNAWKDLYVGDSTIYFVSESIAHPLTIITTDEGIVTLSIDGHPVATTDTTGSQNITASLAVVAQTASFVSGSNVVGSVSSATNATNADKIYVDGGSTTSISVIPTYQVDGGTDGYKNLQLSANPINYYYKTTNLVNNVSGQADLLYLGGGQNSAGAIFLNSTVGLPSYLYSDGPLHLFSQGYKVQISSSADEIELLGNTEVTGSLNVSAGITGSLFGTGSYAVQALSASYAISASHEIIKEVSSSYADTASLALLNVLTASFDQGTRNLAFTKGDSTTFNVNIPGGEVETGSLLLTGSVNSNVLTFEKADGSTFDLTVDTGSAVTTPTGSLLTTASISDATITFEKGDSSTFNIEVDNVTTANTASYIAADNIDGTVATATSASHAVQADNATIATTANTASYIAGANVDGTVALATSASHAVQADTASYVETAQTASYVLQAVSSSFAISASYAVSASHEIIKEVSSSYADTASLALLNVLTASVSDNTITFTKGDQTTFDITVGSDPASRTDSIITGSVTASVDVGSTNFTVDSGSSTLLSLNNTGKLTVSKSINTGVPTSNQWQENLEGSYFNNFDNDSDVSEVLRFIAGLLSASAPDASPNTKVYNSISENKSNTNTSTIRAGYVPQDNTNSDIDYLISQGFASEGGTLFPGKTLYSNSSYSISYSSVAGGSTNVSSSNDSQLFGLGVLTSGGPTDFNVSGTINWFYSDNNSKTQTDVSQSENLLTQNSFGTSNGLTLGKIETSNPSVIPAAYQDGKFATVYSSGLYNGGRSFTNVSSSGWYHISASIAIASGSSDYSPLKAATEEIFWAPVSTINGNIANSSPSFTGAGTEPLTATSRSLSGAPYLQTATWALSSSVSDLFDPVYASSTTISRILDDSSFVSLSGTTSVSTNGGTVQTSNAIFDSTGTTARSTGTVPFRTDIIKLTGSATFNAGTSENINQIGLGDNNFGLTTYARNNNSSESNLNSFNTTYHAAGTFGQPSASGSMGYYGRAQGYDPGTLTGGSETFFGEDFRMDISDNLLSGSYANGDNWDTTFQVENLLGDLDLQVKPGFLVKPGGTYKYWLPDRSSEDYRFYARAFQRSSGTSAASITLTISTSATAVNWNSTSTGLGIAILMESVGVDVQSTARLLDVTDTISNVISTGVSNDNHQNPFTPDIDLYGNSGGSFTDNGSTLTATVPVRNADGFFLNGTYQDLIIILRYKGDISPVTNISISYS